MSLFNQILNALDNPEQEASTNQLNNILDTVQQLSGNYQTQPSSIESAMSIVGNFTRSALKEQRSQGGEAQVQQLVNSFAGNQASSQAINTLFKNSQLQAMIQQISSRTGLNAESIQRMLPVLVPLVLNMLKTGKNTRTAQTGNPVLNSFLDTDGDGDVDVADAMRMASQYLGRNKRRW
ncbi:conserved hypothetical protein [Hyella patelloides LEGE 07179]|uniref:DUF937 domain-containing protein n=1 Tax=Hyella patelloides LEGE 07179 TaxID=945734 RepID=A0A563VLC5_9CYAN|nr:DUF937 domain-containing protein [Hyella patelloides]VEP12133.1 conserved hypothetical protein [Hyella patelloides LEGE 07179]